MIRALFFDVDGTLVSFQTHCVPASARVALAAAHERGIRIFIATGRPAGDLAPLEGISYDGVVALNGARCVAADGTVISHRPISHADFERALELGRKYDFAVALELDEGVFVDRVTPAVEQVARMVAHPVPEAVDLRELFARSECCQMCFYVDAQTERRVMEELPGLVANRWCPLFTDINVRGTDKTVGMTAFMAHHALTTDQVMAFGDGGNDVAMLRAAGIGVAMGGACDAATDAADHVTAGVDEDGIRKALEYFKVID